MDITAAGLSDFDRWLRGEAPARPEVTVYPTRVGNPSPPVAYTPSQALHLLDDAARAQAAAATAATATVAPAVPPAAAPAPPALEQPVAVAPVAAPAPQAWDAPAPRPRPRRSVLRLLGLGRRRASGATCAMCGADLAAGGGCPLGHR